MKRCGRWIAVLVGLLILVNVDAEDGTALEQASTGVKGLLQRIADAVTPKETSLREGRTFGQKRIQFMLLPMIYKMGVMMTMITFLTIISLKSLMVGVVLLILKLAAIFGKAYSFFSSSGHGHSPGWAPPPQPVHVHLHNSASGGGGWTQAQPYGGWETAGPPGPPPDDHYYYKG